MKPKTLWLLSLTALTLFILSACGTQNSNAGSSPSDEAKIQRGELVFLANCSACHSTTIDLVIVGPSMMGIASRSDGIVSGLDARAYIEQSILEPGAYINEDFQNLMPNTYANSITDEDLESLIAYLMTFE